MIIWLASYPKNGNTLLRSILAAYFYSTDGNLKFEHLYRIQQFPSNENFTELGLNLSDEKLIFQNFIEAQKLINKKDNNLKFIKTHSCLSKVANCNFTDLKNTMGAIYVVRDPRNVVTSFAHHYDLNIDDATDTITDPTRFLVKTELMYKTFLGSWSINYNSWKQLKNKVLFIKYEDLVNKKKTVLLRVFKFLNKISLQNQQLDMNKLNRAIKSTEFYKMQELEKKVDFKEGIIEQNTKKRKVFFKFGPKNDWNKTLSSKNVVKIEKAFFKEMKELNYL